MNGTLLILITYGILIQFAKSKKINLFADTLYKMSNQTPFNPSPIQATFSRKKKSKLTEIRLKLAFPFFTINNSETDFRKIV